MEKMLAGEKLEKLAILHNFMRLQSVCCCVFFIFFDTEYTLFALQNPRVLLKLHKRKIAIKKGHLGLKKLLKETSKV